MSKKNLFLLAAWYVAGWIIASIYNKKKPEQLKKELTKAKEIEVILNGVSFGIFMSLRKREILVNF